MQADCEKSGITPETAKAAGFEDLTTAKLSKIIDLQVLSHVDTSGYAIPYFDIDGKPLIDPCSATKPLVRVRTFSANPKIPRYLTRAGGGWDAYLPVGLKALIENGQHRILVITEGEKKALKAVQDGIPAVAISGVYMWHDPMADKARTQGFPANCPLAPTLLSITKLAAANGMTIVVLADSDADANGQVRSAMTKLAQALRHQVCAKVSYMACPSGPAGEKMGLDDWLTNTTSDYVKKEIEDATAFPVAMPSIVRIPAGRVPDPKKMNFKDSDLPAKSSCKDILVSMLASNVLSSVETQNDVKEFWENCFGKGSAPEKLSADWFYAKKTYYKIQAGGLLYAWITYPVAGIPEKPTWHVESDVGKVERLVGSPACWYGSLVQLVDSTDHLLPAIERGTRLDAAMLGMLDTHKLSRIAIPNDLIADKKVWRAAGFDGITDKGLSDWQQLMAAGKAVLPQKIGLADKGWLTLPADLGGGEAYTYGQQLLTFGRPDSAATVVAYDGTGAAAQLSSGVRKGGSENRQHAFLTELFSASPSLAAIAGFAAAAPAMRFLQNAESGILHLFGTSSSGKTTTLQVLASLLGTGASTGHADSLLMSWRTTDNGLESPAEARRDGVLLIDELHMLPDPTKLENSLYTLANGAGKSRMKADTSMRAIKRWSAQVVSTGERSIEHVITTAAGKHSKASMPEGLKFRVIDLAASKTNPIPAASAVPEIMAAYGSGTKGQAAVAHAIEQAVQTDFGHIWEPLVSTIWDQRDSLNSVYASMSQQIKDTADVQGAVMGRRVKHLAAAMVGLGLLLDVLDVSSAQRSLIAVQAFGFLIGTVLPAGAEDLADGTAEADVQLEKFEDALRRNVARLGHVPQSLGWISGSGGDRVINLYASAVSELCAMAGVETKIVQDGLKGKALDGRQVERKAAKKERSSSKVWRLSGEHYLQLPQSVPEF
jgi:hypothetical protein